jgi:anionic cell wall polymer biosynthesis LytR-Cps2A-Psr (LCP) family protein
MSLKSKLTIIIFVILITLVILIRPYYLFLTQTLKVSPLKTLLSIDGIKTYNNNVNILFLGISDASLEGPNLSDSIMVFSYNLKTNRLTSISIPRDVWSPALRQKINAAYAYGYASKGSQNQTEAVKVKNGFTLAKAEIENIIGQPIHYALAVNFNQFENLINFLGGIDVKVDKTFDDYAFPIANNNLDKPPSCDHSDEDIQKFTDSFPTEEEIWKYFSCRYQHIHFDAGITHMDGQTALNFVRSRHAVGSEGTDFAREARQQKVFEAIKNRLIAFVKKPDLVVYNKLYELGNQLVKRDINNQQAAIILKDIFLKGNLKQDKTILSEDFFVNPQINLERYDGLWVLIPKDDNIKLFQDYIDCRLNNKTNCEQLKNK